MSQIDNHEKASTVCLDAAEVKRIRESHQLTQLYVSKVVGVTTDTISRWENNRYPTIRRENALKLAEALDVPLDYILQKPASGIPVEQPVPQRKRPVVWLALACGLFVAILAAYSLFARPEPRPAPVSSERVLPNFAGPGSTIPVQIRLDYHQSNAGIILREYYPKGWKIVQAQPPASSLDNVNGVARWIIKAGDERDRIVYLVQVDPAAELNSRQNFRGEIVASREGNQSAVPVLGESTIDVASAHWADADDDGRIDDGEMLEASFTIEDMSGVHIDWNDLEKLWAAGRYTWSDKKKLFVPEPVQP